MSSFNQTSSAKSKNHKSHMDGESTPAEKAYNTGRWAKIMTKWLISHSTKGGKKWQFVSFEGPKGRESTGIVDFIAIRRHHEIFFAHVGVRANVQKLGSIVVTTLINA